VEFTLCYIATQTSIWLLLRIVKLRWDF